MKFTIILAALIGANAFASGGASAKLSDESVKSFVCQLVNVNEPMEHIDPKLDKTLPEEIYAASATNAISTYLNDLKSGYRGIQGLDTVTKEIIFSVNHLLQFEDINCRLNKSQFFFRH